MTDTAVLATETKQDARAQLAQLLARYDNGAIPPAVLSVVRSLRVERAWMEHRGRQGSSA